MTEIIKIQEKNGEKAVSARELYAFLEVNAKFTDWCKRMFEYGFIENVDYSLLNFEKPTVHNKIDYALTLDCSKEIAMLQRTEKGKQARQYFIEREKQLRNAPAITDEELINEVMDYLTKKAEQQKPQPLNTPIK